MTKLFSSLFGGRTPDLTAAQIMAALTWVASQAVAYGWLSPGTKQYVLSIASTVVAAAWKIADSVIRHGRATGAAAKKA